MSLSGGESDVIYVEPVSYNYVNGRKVAFYVIKPIITIGIYQGTLEIDLLSCMIGNSYLIQKDNKSNNNKKPLTCMMSEFSKYLPSDFYKKYAGIIFSCYLKMNPQLMLNN